MINSAKGIRKIVSEINWALKDKKTCPGHKYMLKVDEKQCVVNIKSSFMAKTKEVFVHWWKMRVERYTVDMVKASPHRVVYNSEDETTKCLTNNRSSMMEYLSTG